jgi:hypothetical protein
MARRQTRKCISVSARRYEQIAGLARLTGKSKSAVVEWLVGEKLDVPKEESHHEDAQIVLPLYDSYHVGGGNRGNGQVIRDIDSRSDVPTSDLSREAGASGEGAGID